MLAGLTLHRWDALGHLSVSRIELATDSLRNGGLLMCQAAQLAIISIPDAQLHIVTQRQTDVSCARLFVPVGETSPRCNTHQYRLLLTVTNSEPDNIGAQDPSHSLKRP